jgi:hypothetical protein
VPKFRDLKCDPPLFKKPKQFSSSIPCPSVQYFHILMKTQKKATEKCSSRSLKGIWQLLMNIPPHFEQFTDRSSRGVLWKCVCRLHYTHRIYVGNENQYLLFEKTFYKTILSITLAPRPHIKIPHLLSLLFIKSKNSPRY